MSGSGDELPGCEYTLHPLLIFNLTLFASLGKLLKLSVLEFPVNGLEFSYSNTVLGGHIC